jgi:hypothetical protein
MIKSLQKLMVGLCLLVSLAGCDHQGRAQVVVSPQGENNGTNAPTVPPTPLSVVELNQVISTEQTNPAKVTAAAGTAAQIRYGFNTGVFNQLSLIALEQNRDGTAECQNRSVVLKDADGKIVVPSLSLGVLLDVSARTDYVLEITRSAKCSLPEFAARTVVMVKIGQGASAFSPSAMIARQCRLEKSLWLILPVNVGTPIAQSDSDGEGIYHLPRTSNLCGGKLNVAGTGSVLGSTVGLSGISTQSQMISTGASSLPGLDYTLTFDIGTEYKTGTLECQSGDRKTRALTDCEDVAVQVSDEIGE